MYHAHWDFLPIGCLREEAVADVARWVEVRNCSAIDLLQPVCLGKAEAVVVFRLGCGQRTVSDSQNGCVNLFVHSNRHFVECFSEFYAPERWRLQITIHGPNLCKAIFTT